MVHSAADAPRGWTPAVQAVLWLTIAHLTAAGVIAVAHRRYEFLVYLAFTPVLISIIMAVHLRIRLSLGLLWSLSVLALLHMTGGLTAIPADWPVEGRHRLYDWWLVPGLLKYDQIIHAFGSAVATWFCWQLLQRTVASKSGWGFRDLRPVPGLLLFCILSGMGIASVNEIAEFIATRFIREHGVGGYTNTLMDMVYNTIGSVIVATLIWWHGRRACDPDAKVVCRTPP